MQKNDFVVVQSKKKSKEKFESQTIIIVDEEKKEYPLLRKWDLGHICGKKMLKQNCPSNVFAKSLKIIGTFDDVLTMWSYFNHIDIKLLGLNSCLYVFEHNILPMWEDKNNVGGNIYKSYICEEYIDEIFLKILLSVIGEILCDLYNDLKINIINGIYVKKSYKTYEFQIWTKKNKINLMDILFDITKTEWKCIDIH